ncbi:fructose-specific PTS transporter subunit EIIC [Streptomyces sp. NPDC050121]|uniref:fructose-specific PTS transporter subunit EIIC n=1 Tax=Streptomyces sp. NPDC050121 TaxID=3365601 RepID=UPI0037B60AE7
MSLSPRSIRLPIPLARRKEAYDDQEPSARTRTGRWLVASVPWFGPFVVVAALMKVLALAVSGPGITDTADRILATADWTHPQTWAALLLKLGASGLGFLPVAVAGYLAYGMAGRPALIPGLLGGMAALGIQGGVLAALVAGLTAGAATLALGRVSVPSALRGIASTVLFPLLVSVIAAAVLFVGLAEGLFSVSTWLDEKLVWLQFNHTVLTGMVLGLAVCSDFGGTISRTAVAFGVMGVSGDDPSKFSPANMTMMAAVMAAGMVPPLGMALATLVRRRLFTRAERTHGRAAWLFGLTSVTEGAIPFALADPLRVVPASMAGGAVGGGLVMAFGAEVSVPFGGFLAFGQMRVPLFFALAVVAGSVVTAGVVIALKSLRRGEPGKASVTRAKKAKEPKRVSKASVAA